MCVFTTVIQFVARTLLFIGLITKEIGFNAFIVAFTQTREHEVVIIKLIR